MKQEQTLEYKKLIAEYNKLIAEYMGWRFENPEKDIVECFFENDSRWADDFDFLNNILTSESGFAYHLDLNKLMAVVNKICQTHVNDFSLTIKPFFYSVQISNRYKKFNGQSLNSEIEAIYQAVIRFIKWHNRHMKWYKNLMQKHKQC